MRIEYRTVEGATIERIIDDERGITVDDVDCLAMQYYEKTNRIPECVYIEACHYNKILKDMSSIHNYQHLKPLEIGVSSFLNVKIMTSMGAIQVQPIYSSFIPVLVGTSFEYKDNDINTLFEEIILKDCERV